MPWLPLFLDENDAHRLFQWLNAHNDIAFIMPDGPKRWKAAPAVPPLANGKYTLWNRAGGSLIITGNEGVPRPVSNPAAGWAGREVSPWLTDPGLTQTPLLFDLDLFARHRPYSYQERKQFERHGQHMIAELKKAFPRLFEGGKEVGFKGPLFPQEWEADSALAGNRDFLRLSSFSWIGDRDPIPGREIPKAAQQWWDSLKSWVESEAVALGDFCDIDDGVTEQWRLWAFPSALSKLQQGMDYDANGFPLDKEIRAARRSK